MSNRRRFFSNPFSDSSRFQNSKQNLGAVTSDESLGRVDYSNVMTKSGAINKTFILTGILLITAIYSFLNPSMTLMWVGLIGGLISVLVASFKPETSPISAPIYAAFEGLFIGSVTMLYAMIAGDGVTPDYGIIGTAVLGTLGVLVAMITAYKTGLIKPTAKLRAFVITALGAILFIYMANILISLFGFGGIPYLHTAHPIGIIITLVVIGVAALSLIFDFEIYEKGEAMKAPKYMEWFAGLSLLVTLVWIYIEILRLAAILSSGD